ncbi:MAG TPA: NADH:flavin oxidoreductase/NADH oxidase [Phycisphaerales bacterium]|nr:NADH:flavin oxidoreductase/NADH oxidase [Phycisphaerales bacterium]HMP37992.1 NADH:flavin oxidoreductase/NADH oxidase [Phycisphaerales bacterium]
MSKLFDPITFRGVTLRNRIALSPMCQYSSEDGFATDWHVTHLGSRAVGGAALIVVEATGVTPEGRITPNCLGIWKDDHVPGLLRATSFIKQRGAVPAIQIAHAGVKASRRRPWHPAPNAYVPEHEGGWMPVGPSAQRFSEDGPVPHELTVAEIRAIRDAFAAAARRAVAAGFEIVEIHSAHGYLSHSFLSPLMNRRTDAYGGPFDHRTSFLLETVRAVRHAIPASMPLFVRISATDWVDGGWSLEESVELARRLRAEGVDLIDCSSGGAARQANIPVGPGYQVPLAERIRRDAEIPTGAVGLITEPAQAEEIIAAGRADLLLLGRQLLREPYWPLRAWSELRPGVPAPIATEYAWALPETRRR